MEVETMLEDDVFFAELSKRISLLITDDDEGGADFAAAAAQFVPASAAAAPLPVSLRSHPSSSPSIKHVRARVLVRVGGSGPGEAIASVACGLGASR
jgi:hypothetical protein